MTHHCVTLFIETENERYFMKTIEGENIRCVFTNKICYTEREAGHIINGCKKHIYIGNSHWAKQGGYTNSKNIPRRKYYCKDCGFYHVTHLALYDYDSQNGLWEEAFYKEFNKKNKIHA